MKLLPRLTTWKIIQLAVVITAVSCSSGVASIAVVGFEPGEGFHATASPTGILGWIVDPGGIVINTDSEAGSQSVRLTGGQRIVTLYRPIAAAEWGQKAIGYYDFWVKPSADASAEPATSIAADGAELAFIKDGDHGVVAAYSAAADGTGKSVLSKATFSIDASNVAQDWLRITIREDYSKRTWDVYVDGVLALIDLGMDGKAARPTSFTMTISPGQSMGLDAWQLSEQQVLFKDSDDDGMPDDFEKANGLNPNVDDRNQDPDGDGMSNIEEFLRGFRPSEPGPGTRKYIYVDNRAGNDGFSGRLSYVAGQDGPKASIHAAAKSAADGDFIVILQGSGRYREGDVNVKGKNFNLSIQGNVQIQ